MRRIHPSGVMQQSHSRSSATSATAELSCCSLPGTVAAIPRTGTMAIPDTPIASTRRTLRFMSSPHNSKQRKNILRFAFSIHSKYSQTIFIFHQMIVNYFMINYSQSITPPKYIHPSRTAYTFTNKQKYRCKQMNSPCRKCKFSDTCDIKTTP